MAKKEQPAPEPVRFEDAMARLEALVAEMESGQLPLETLLTRYEEGIRLVKLCGTTLDAAEQRIRQIAHKASGEPEVVAGPPDEASASPPDGVNNDITPGHASLF